MFKVPNGQNPYSAIGRYIRDNTTTIEDMIAVIEINGFTMNELLLVDMHEDECFVWKSDWWEGEKDIALIDFFPVSDAQKPIHCKDCKHFIREDMEEYTPYGFYNTYFHAFCDKHFDVDLGEFIDVKTDDFCSFAYRRE